MNEHRSLSTGQIQKIQLARALLRKTDVLLFDESFSNFDPVAKENVLEYIKKYRSNAIVVLVSHNPVDYAICDQILEL